MYTIIRDNKDILRYRGILTPSQTLLDLQNSAATVARLNLGKLTTNELSQFASDKPNSSNTVVSTNPFMRLMPQSGGNGANEVFDFYFPFTPQNIEYSDMSDEVAEIQRVGTTPLVTFKSHKLMKISFEFLVAVPYDGITIDVEDSINLLRNFSTNSQRSVVFYNLDNLLLAGWTYRNGPQNRPPYFTVTDMSITARQRNASNKITQAIVRMSFVENQNPTIVIKYVPPFRAKKKKKKKKRIDELKPRKVADYVSTALATAKEQTNWYLVK